jgi:uncharacterized metal-binding protein YceD (DUF177 family)
MNKVLNLREGKFPIKIKQELTRFPYDTDMGELVEGSVDLSIEKLSYELFVCKGAVNSVFGGICQSCLKQIRIDLNFEINVVIKDSDILLDDATKPDESHFQQLKFFQVELLIFEEISLNYPAVLKCQNGECVTYDQPKKEEKLQPFKKIRDLLD